MNARWYVWLPSTLLAMTLGASSATGQNRSIKPIDPCLGPNPSCSSGCPSSSGDGLNDAWKIAGGIDLNGDGRVDAIHDLILPDVKLGRKDIFVQYDYLYLPDQGTSCTPTPDSPLNPGNPNFSTDCEHGQTCLKNVCRGHSHAPSRQALQLVVDAFKAQGIALHIDHKPHPIAEPPDSIISFATPRQLVASPECAGPGGISFYELKSKYFDPRKTDAYHYAAFGHYSTCDESLFTGQACFADSECQAVDPALTCDNFRCSNASHCAACPPVKSTQPRSGASGIAENDDFQGGNDLIVSLGPFLDQGPVTDNMTAGAFMHELGHNLGLTHGGVGTGATSGERYKPNFLSVMGYSYNLTGIGSTIVPGPFPTTTVDPSTGYRIDYSGRVLPSLNEQDLNETVGIQGPPDNRDVAVFWSNFGTCKTYGPSNGTPIDWDIAPPIDSNGACLPYSAPGPYADMHVAADISASGGLSTLHGFADWPNLKYDFQCSFDFYDPVFGTATATASPSQTPSTVTMEPELTFAEASKRHLIYSQRKVNISIRPGCSESSKPVAPGQPGAITVALLGESDLDVAEVERSSLRFGGEQPLRVSTADVNSDGYPDLVLTFEMARLKLLPNDNVAWLSGWLKDSQELVGSDFITIVPSMAFVNESCK